MPTPPVLHLPPLHFAHGADAPLFNGLPLTLGAGLHWLQGDSGSGKTTLLRLLAAELPGLGTASLNGRTLPADSAAWRAAVCHVDVRADGVDHLTAADLAQQLRRRHPALDLAAWQQHIDGFGLAPHAAKTLFMLSTGMRRKAALAAVLASGATLLLLDEPNAGLDAPAIAWLQQALQDLATQPGRAALIACGSWPPGLPCAGTVVLNAR